MLRYADTAVVFTEVPDEITLAVNVTGCPYRCEGCHSPYLRENTGTPLTEETLDAVLGGKDGVSCVAFMGGDSEYLEVLKLAVHAKKRGYKTCWYSGRDGLPDGIDLSSLDFLKLGHYDKRLGPLDSPDTNQRFYKVTAGQDGPAFEDMTYRFTKKNEIKNEL